MPATGRDIHWDAPLTNVALNYRPAGMIADMIAPVVPVAKQSNLYVVWDQGDIMRVETGERSPGTEAKRIFRIVSSGSYFAKNYALKTSLTLEDMENADEAYIQTLREGRAQFLLDKLYLGWEKRVADLCTSGSNVYSYSATASAWNVPGGGAQPVYDVLAKMDIVQDVTGYRPNRIIMGGQAWRSFRVHDNVIKHFFGTAGGSGRSRLVTRRMAAELFEVDDFLVGDAYYNSGGEGLDETMTSIWKDSVVVYYAPPNPSIEVPSALYTFRWARPGVPNLQVERHPFDGKVKSEEIEVGYYQDEKIVSKSLIALQTNVNSST